MEIDIYKLRADLMDYYGTAMLNGFPMAIVNLSRIESATDEDILQIALKENFNIEKYIV